MPAAVNALAPGAAGVMIARVDGINGRPATDAVAATLPFAADEAPFVLIPPLSS